MIIKKIAKIKLERGFESQRVERTFRESELVYSIDKERMFIGDGETKGGILVSNRNYVVESINGDFGLPSTVFYGDIINDRITNNTYIVGYGPDGVTLSAILISDGVCISKIKKDLDDILNTIIPLTGCLVQPCEGPPPTPLSWIQEPFDIIVKTGETASFAVSAFGDGDISYQWYVSKSPYNIIEEATDNVLMIESATKSDEGYYKCEAMSTLVNSVTSKAGKLTVISPTPSFVSNTYTLEGGYQPATYTFLFRNSAFFEPSLLNKIKTFIGDFKGSTSIVKTIKTLEVPNNTGVGTKPTITMYYIENTNRINWNSKIILNTDGTYVFPSKSPLGALTIKSTYLTSIFDKIVDVYVPSVAAIAYILLSNGDYVEYTFTGNDSTDKQRLVVNNIKKIIQKSKSHSIISSLIDNDGNILIYENNKVFVIDEIDESDLLSIGASIENGYWLCKKSENQNLYKIEPTKLNSIKRPSLFKANLNKQTNFKSHNLPLTGTEVILDVKANEDLFILLTNKNVYLNNSIYPFTIGEYIAPHTSYSYKVYAKDNKFYQFFNSTSLDAKPDLFYSPLKSYLDTIKAANP